MQTAHSLLPIQIPEWILSAEQFVCNASEQELNCWSSTQGESDSTRMEIANRLKTLPGPRADDIVRISKLINFAFLAIELNNTLLGSDKNETFTMNVYNFASRAIELHPSLSTARANLFIGFTAATNRDGSSLCMLAQKIFDDSPTFQPSIKQIAEGYRAKIGSFRDVLYWLRPPCFENITSQGQAMRFFNRYASSRQDVQIIIKQEALKEIKLLKAAEKAARAAAASEVAAKDSANAAAEAAASATVSEANARTSAIEAAAEVGKVITEIEAVKGQITTLNSTIEGLVSWMAERKTAKAEKDAAKRAAAEASAREAAERAAAATSTALSPAEEQAKANANQFCGFLEKRVNEWSSGSKEKGTAVIYEIRELINSNQLVLAERLEQSVSILNRLRANLSIANEIQTIDLFIPKFSSLIRNK